MGTMLDKPPRKLSNRDLSFPFCFTYTDADGVVTKRKLVNGHIERGYLHSDIPGYGYRSFKLSRINEVITLSEFNSSPLAQSSSQSDMGYSDYASSKRNTPQRQIENVATVAKIQDKITIPIKEYKQLKQQANVSIALMWLGICIILWLIFK